MSLPEVVLRERVIPVARGLDASNAPQMVGALSAGGLHSIEITVETDGGIEAIEAVGGSEMTVGAGTIITLDQAQQAVDAGAQFIVSPHLDTELLGWAAENGIPYVPGGLTPTEIVTAWRHHPAAVKVFPAHMGGPGYLNSIRGPLPDVMLIPTGGVDAGNAAAYLTAGAVAVGVGGWLTAHDDLSIVTERARKLVAEVV